MAMAQEHAIHFNIYFQFHPFGIRTYVRTCYLHPIGKVEAENANALPKLRTYDISTRST